METDIKLSLVLLITTETTEYFMKDNRRVPEPLNLPTPKND